MIADTSPEPASLAEILVIAARRASDSHLFAMLSVGFGGGLVLVNAFGRPGWLGASACFAIGAYGGWGLSDRRLNALWSVPGSPPARVNAWRLMRAVAAIFATLAAVTVLGSVFVPMLGLWRS